MTGRCAADPQPADPQTGRTVDVSVIVPAHNRPDYLPASVASILEQRWSGTLEILCIDDGSEIDPFSRLPEPLPDNIRLFRKPNAGAGSARRHGIERARGRYIAFNDDDDLWLPERLRLQFEFLEAHADIDMIFGDLIEFDARGEAPTTHFTGRVDVLEHAGERVGAGDPPIHRFARGSLIGPFMTNIPLFHQAVLARRSLIERMGSLDPRLRAADCTDFALRATHHGVLAYLDMPTFRLRRGHVHETADDSWMDRDIGEFFAIYPDYPDALRQEIQPWLGHFLANRGYLHFKHGRYRLAAEAYRDAARHGPIGARSRVKWGLAAGLGLLLRAG
jgi:glycosyltransferase involved in cell wall biosynthesis